MTDFAADDAAWEAQMAVLTVKEAFYAFVGLHGGENTDMAINAYSNAFAVEVHGEYADDLQRWTVALSTARDYVDAGVSSF